MKRIILFAFILGIILNSYSQATGAFKDPRDGKLYKTVKIGNQWMMAENLAYEPNPGNYWAYNNKNGNQLKFGLLYDWKTANKVAPKGWHLPSKAEWELVIYILGREYEKVYMEMMEGGSSGFRGLPGGYRSDIEIFTKIDIEAHFWSASPDSEAHQACTFYLDSEFRLGGLSSKDIDCGLNVRLFMD